MSDDLNKPDPKLQSATREIEEILKKYNIGGYIAVASQTHGEYLFHFPEWSICQKEIGPDGRFGLRFKTKGKDHNSLVGTVHMLQLFQIQGADLAKHMDELIEMLESKMFITGGPERIK